MKQLATKSSTFASVIRILPKFFYFSNDEYTFHWTREKLSAVKKAGTSKLNEEKKL